MAHQNIYIGSIGEGIAINYLSSLGYSIRQRNYRCRWGEIDFIAQKENVTYFIEVKTRLDDSKGQPYESVTKIKVSHLLNAIREFIFKSNLQTNKLAFIVISVTLNKNLSLKKVKLYDYSEIFERRWN